MRKDDAHLRRGGGPSVGPFRHELLPSVLGGLFIAPHFRDPGAMEGLAGEGEAAFGGGERGFVLGRLVRYVILVFGG